MTQVYLGSSSGIVPSVMTALQARFSRNPSATPINRYIQRFPSVDLNGKGVTTGLYTRVPTLPSVTLDTIDPNWPEGANRPTPRQSEIEFPTFKTKRSSFTAEIDQRALTHGGHLSSEFLSIYTDEKANLSITQKTAQVEAALTTPISGRNATLDTILGGSNNTLLAATASNKNIKKTFDAAVTAIITSTHGMVTRDMIVAVMSQDVADDISSSAEFQEILAKSPYAYDVASGGGIINPNTGTLNKLYGVECVVHQDGFAIGDPNGTLKTAYRRFYSNINSTVYTPIVFVVRPDKLQAGVVNGGVTGLPVNGNGGARSATVVEIFAEDMTAEQNVDVRQRKHYIDITNDYTIEVANPAALYMVTNVRNED